MRSANKTFGRSSLKKTAVVLGIVVTILGHLFDHAEKYPWVVDVFAPGHARALKAYEEMLKSVDFRHISPSKVIKPGNSGFVEMIEVLAVYFPELASDGISVQQIRIKDIGIAAGGYWPEKGISYTGAQPNFEVTLNSGQVLSKYLFDLRPDIRKRFLEDWLFYWGSFVFWAGVLITTSSLFI